MNNLSTEDKTMIAEGAEFRVGKTYFKRIRGILHRCTLTSSEWVKAYSTESYYTSSYKSGDYVDLQRTETPTQQEISSKQGDCIANLVHSVCAELQLMYSYLPATDEFLVDYNDTTFKLKYSDDVGKLRCMISLMEELSYE